MKKRVLVTIPNLSSPGGVIFYWQAIWPTLSNYNQANWQTMEVGGYGKNIFLAFKDQWKFYKKITLNTDLVVLNPSLGFKSFFRDAIFAKQLQRKKIPFVVFFHGWEPSFEKEVSKKYVRFFINSFGKASKIIVLSSDFKEKLLEWGYKGEIIIETTAVDNSLTKNYNFDLKSTSNGTIRILFLSRLILDKGGHITMEAFKNLRKKYTNIKLTIAGDGPEYDNIKDFAQKEEDIIMTGHVTGLAKRILFENTDIYCLPTCLGEGLPISVLEAMAFGIPVITTRVGGLKDFFEDGKMGFFIDIRDAKSLENSLVQLISNPEKMKEIGNYNHEYAENNLMGDKVAKRIYGYLEDLLFN